MDLVKANTSGTPEWVQIVDYVKDYGLSGGVSPDSLYDLAYRLT